MLVSFETNMIVIQKNASVRFSTKLLSVNQHFWNSSTKQNHSGDIAVTENTFNKMIKISDDFLRAYPSPNAYLWDQNFVNGQYVIAYAFDYGLNQNVKSMLPKVIIKIEIKSEICKELSKIYR